jgi:dUTP pyrophosphatase
MSDINSDYESIREIKTQFEKLKEISGIYPDYEYGKELEELFKINFDEMSDGVVAMFNNKDLYVELIDDSLELPSYAYETDSGFDLYSTEDVVIPKFGRSLVSTGIKLGIPEGYEIQIRPKSGLAINQGLTVLNTPGTIDAGYTGEIKVIIFNTNNIEVLIKKGSKIAQAVLSPVVSGKHVNIIKTSSVETRDRGDNGFGSTGI